MPAGAGESKPGQGRGTSPSSISILHLLQGPYRHYILNVLWILINMLCMLLIIKQLYRLHREFTDKEVKVSYQIKDKHGHMYIRK